MTKRNSILVGDRTIGWYAKEEKKREKEIKGKRTRRHFSHSAQGVH